MADAGDIYLADVNDEVRRQVLVVSNSRFHDLAGRAFVLPVASPRPYPWRIEHDSVVYALPTPGPKQQKPEPVGSGLADVLKQDMSAPGGT